MSTGNRIRPLRVGALLALALLAALIVWPSAASAHPLGNFTINRYSRLEFAEDGVRITYILDFAELPTLQELRFLDTDGDGRLSGAEATAYLDERMPMLLDGLHLAVGDDALALSVVDRSARLLEGQAGLQTFRLEARLHAELPRGWERDGFGGYMDRNYQDRLGWRELVVVGGPGVEVGETSALRADVSDELRSYPEDALSSPLDLAEATFTLVPGNGAVGSDTAGQAAERVQARTNGGRATDRVANLIAAEQLSPSVVLIAVVAAFFWGAVHALSPGHGKTVVAAYLVGARGTARHAAFLGLTVTITHTAGIFALGLVTLYLSSYILPEDLYPWLSVASGLLVVGIGLTLGWSRLRAARHGSGHHHHDHDHEHHHHHHHGELAHTHDGHTHSHLPPGADGRAVTWRSLLALGVSGGLIPCPSALVLLLGAISLQREALGIVLVLAFSLGLAAVLTGIGLLLVYARRTFQRFSPAPRVPRLLPVASAAVVSITGVAIVVGSLGQAGVL
jgi:ABC-type nickel/cobalt efflux system permease component RcnA